MGNTDLKNHYVHIFGLLYIFVLQTAVYLYYYDHIVAAVIFDTWNGCVWFLIYLHIFIVSIEVLQDGCKQREGKP